MMIRSGSEHLREHAGWRGRVFAFCMNWAGRKHESVLAERKRELFADLAGTVLEIGPGTGANLAYFPRGIRWIGIEPNPFMHEYLRKRAGALGIEVDIRRGMAEQIGTAPESVDVVISTLVLCSVKDLDGVLREVYRVLKPGGRFIFLEHVGAPRGTWLRRIQQAVKPAWRAVSAGCEPDRDIPRALRVAGFERIDMDCFRVPAPVVSPHIAGVAIKKG